MAFVLISGLCETSIDFDHMKGMFFAGEARCVFLCKVDLR